VAQKYFGKTWNNNEKAWDGFFILLKMFDFCKKVFHWLRRTGPSINIKKEDNINIKKEEWKVSSDISAMSKKKENC
jgi:hypothetical protein